MPADKSLGGCWPALLREREDKVERRRTAVVHRCLLVPEILRCVAEAVCSTTRVFDGTAVPSAIERGTYTSMALVCRAFYDPAMAALWARATSLSPLVKCFPDDVWTESIKRVSFRRAPESSEWTHVLRNATRIRHLSCSEYPGLKEQLWTLRMNIPPRTVLLPNVTRLTIESAGLHSATCLPHLIGTRLSICATKTVGNDVLSALLAGLSQTSLGLRTLRLASISLECTNILTWFGELKVLESGSSVSASAAMGLANSVNLQHLALPLLNPFPLERLDTTATFSKLTVLNLANIDTVSSAKSLIRSVNSNNLRILKLQFARAFLDPCGLWDAIGEHTALRDLEVSVIHDEDLGQNFSLAPLHRLHNLEMLSISMHGFELTDSSIPTLARSWPELSCLVLIPNEAMKSSPPGLTLGSLELFAAYMPFLNDLGTVLDTTIIPPAPRMRSRYKMWLALQRSPLSKASWRSVASYISAVYPFSQVEFADDDDDDDERTGERYWENVHEMMATLCAVRDEERAFAFHLWNSMVSAMYYPPPTADGTLAAGGIPLPPPPSLPYQHVYAAGPMPLPPPVIVHATPILQAV